MKFHLPQIHSFCFRANGIIIIFSPAISYFFNESLFKIKIKEGMDMMGSELQAYVHALNNAAGWDANTISKKLDIKKNDVKEVLEKK